MPRGVEGEKTWESFLDAEPMTASLGERTRTVSFSMNWDWVQVESHCCLESAIVVLHALLRGVEC